MVLKSVSSVSKWSCMITKQMMIKSVVIKELGFFCILELQMPLSFSSHLFVQIKSP